MLYDRYVAKSLERQQVKQTRQFYHALAELNLELSQLHKKIEKSINKENYQFATEYVDQFISYTTIWNLKFVYNLENPEVALLQIFHLKYIFDNEPSELFTKERALFEYSLKSFDSINPFSDSRVHERYQKMLQFIEEKKSEFQQGTQ